ncbi:hypothetical protein DMA12_32695 [Amycolatopsis balhimycina DSM 5908]|uniref:Uncharacterized protein n=1 Tax=Amycolatopsis balhimycina DSM 5908 TaxID=1081091 RepID=A0A428W5U8_AMYBA|nr:hypothetical protein [Amycolatopsis balhimycina]RSM38468.1 hypothetical protein DMA12_32695 [Amycolatopsis balhimycina DSM 5908]
MSTPLFAVAAERTAGHPFPRQLAEALGGHGSRPGLTQLEAAAERIRADRDAFAAWLRDLAADPVAAAEIAKRSYWHPNGFAKIVLHAGVEPEFRVRLHVWPRSETPSRGESNPHSHRWEFASHVLAGTGMHMVEFTETAEGGKAFRRYRYGADLANPAALTADGEVRLKRRAVPHVQGGDVYTCDTSIVHTVRPIDAGLTATVVVQGPRRTPTTVVYCAPGESDDQPNFDLTEADFEEIVSEVRSILDRAVS